MDESIVRTCALQTSAATGEGERSRGLPSAWAERFLAAPPTVRGSVAAVAATAALSLLMLALRGRLDVEASALILLVPVILGAELGGLAGGVVAMATGVVAFDVVFLPPLFHVSVGDTADWVTLVVYVVAMSVTVRVVVRMNAARSEARRRESEVRRIFDVSELLVREASQEDLLVTIVTTVRRAFDLDGAALLLPLGGRLEMVASSGEELSEEERRQLSSDRIAPITIQDGSVPSGGLQAVALVASGQAIGLLAVRGLGETNTERELVRVFANHLAVALERAQLREKAVRAQLLEEIDRIRQSLVGAVSHDLRTPLTTIKVSTSTLLDSDARLERADAVELLRLIDLQADRLNRMVSNVLDMTRIQSGTLELRSTAVEVKDLFDEAMAVLGPLAELERVCWASSGDLPPVEVDHVLVCQVLANLIDNATRYAPEGTPVIVSARRGAGDIVEVEVADQGVGVPADERTSIFQMFNRRESGGRGGLGLAIARAFVEAHEQRIWVEDSDSGGARFVFTLPRAHVAEVA